MDAHGGVRGGSPGRPLRRDLGDGLSLFIALRIAFGLVALYLWFGGGLPGPCHFELARNGWQTLPPLAADGATFPLVGVWQRWDACWYTKIATYGYEAGTDSGAFFPLFPFLTGVVGRLLFGRMALAGLVVAGVGFVVAVTGLLRLVGRDFGRPTAERTVALMAAWPAAFFLLAPFTESVFLAASVWAIVGARERRWGLAMVAATLVGLTRFQGIVIMLPLAWEAARTVRDLRRAGRSLATPAALLPVVATVLPAVSVVIFSAFAALWTGQLPFESQGAWGGTNFHPPWETVAASWTWALEHGDPLQLLNLVALVGSAVVALAGVRRLPAAYSLYVLPQIAMLAIRIQPTPLTSTLRYLGVLFPIFVVIALATRDRRRFAAWAFVSVLFLGLLLVRFLHGDFVA